MFRYVIEGNPVPLARARFGNKRVWDAQRQLKFNCRMLLKHQHGDAPFIKGPFKVEMWFFFGIPQSMSPAKRLKKYGTPHCIKPDVDNLIKFILDIAQGTLIENDCAVASLAAQKVYDENPRSEFLIIPLEKNEKENQ